MKGTLEARTLRGCSGFCGGVLPFGASVAGFLILSDDEAFLRDMQMQLHVDRYIVIIQSLARSTSKLPPGGSETLRPAESANHYARYSGSCLMF